MGQGTREDPGIWCRIKYRVPVKLEFLINNGCIFVCVCVPDTSCHVFHAILGICLW